MGDLSENFNHKDFACRCSECKGEYRIHLGLVGILEAIASHFSKRPKILSAYWCDAFHEKKKKERRSYHAMGKAVHVSIEGVSLPLLFKFAETISETRGLGFYPEEGFIHLDTRSKDPAKWVKEGGSYLPLTSDKRAKYGLG